MSMSKSNFSNESGERDPLLPTSSIPINKPDAPNERANVSVPKSPSTSALFNKYSPNQHSNIRHGSHSAYNEQGDDKIGRSAGLTESYRQGSVSHQVPPLFHRLLSGHYTVTNPNLGSSGGFEYANLNSSNLNLNSSGILESSASIYSVPDLEEQQRRLNVLTGMRPHKLIGNYKSLTNWMDNWKPNVSKIRNKKVRKYYEDQNYLIERFQEIDNLLDYGKIHINMLSNYSRSEVRQNNKDRIEDTEDNQIGTNMNSNTTSYNSMVSHRSRFNEIPGNVETEGAHFLGYNQEETSQNVLFAILVNFFVNFILLIGKIIVCILSNSISVVASLVDSILDFLSTFIIFIANKLSTTKTWRTQHAYPVGRSGLEPLGVLIFSVIIIISFFQVGQASFKRLFLSLPEDRMTAEIGKGAIIIMTTTILCKIGCWVWCSKSKSSSVQALAQDAMTDIIFNFVSLIMPAAGHYLNVWWLDPLGALLLSVYIIVSWSKTAFEHIENLTGAVASPLDYKVILYLSYRFAESIKQITSLKVYHVGDNLNVEIDLVFDNEEFNLSLKDVHDIAEALQYAIETLPMVERAFVHIDYMEGNFRGHLK
ncbi:DEHA2F13244p [Debaryomyces hansenii CBS767]|uniref:DEHA2F13244p n=1 Tax=Debaryomyces hansenii (strain ATCC 36239 / CBS 767 / BCRC 21394 / JCM 1990 / NBRC 0083 / IGC 2968) TaxID=284592 RepID=B5RUG0_DEBHA|nr:DEHA2F13244p [Debaryomyces hansenii CBS767]CAR66338.1 DEHA2F13244p [Debaryomyces hansenii CBS767]|eukprot:XP_002770814.1 DEHA2F13244p [Debaryomyces hansenii CBS767]